MDVLLEDIDGKQYRLASRFASIKGIQRFFNSRTSAQNFLKTVNPVETDSWVKAWIDTIAVITRKPTIVRLTEEEVIESIVSGLVSKSLLLFQLMDATDAHIDPVTSRSNRGALGAADIEEMEPAQPHVNPHAQMEPEATPYDQKNSESSHAAGKICKTAKTGASSVNETVCKGCPISMVSGEELLALTDTTLPGPMAFTWQRVYRTGHSRDIGLGCGWTHSGSDKLVIDGMQIDYFDAEGRMIQFKRPRLKQRSHYLPERMNLDAISNTCYVLKQEGQWDKVFTRLGETSIYRLTQLRHSGFRAAKTRAGSDVSEQGYAINFHYNTQNALMSIAGNWGKSLRLDRDPQGRVTAIDLSNDHLEQCKRVVEYDYDQQGDLIAQRNACGVGEKYQYTNHIFTRRTLVTGFNYYYEWDRLDNQARCVRNWGDQGIYNYHFQWDPDNNTSKATDSRGYTSTFIYNDYGQIIQEIDNEGAVHENAYDKGRKTTYTDPEGNTTRYFFDAENNAAGYCDALGNSQVSRYFQGKQTAFTDKDGARWQQQYNEHGQLHTLIDPLGSKTQYTYNTNGLLSSLRDSQGCDTQYQWNSSGELSAVTDSMGHKRQFRYDAWGQVIEAETLLDGNVFGGITCFHYTPTGLLEKVVSPNDDITTYTYNDNNQLIRYSDPRGRLTQFEYDGLSQVVRRIDPEGHSLQYKYDKERNLIALINENGDCYTFTYDGNERLIKEKGFDGREQHYTYNKSGYLIQHIDADSVKTEFERNALGQMLTKVSDSLKDPKLPQERSRFTYDPNGRLKESYNADQYLAFEYDRLGHVKKEHHSDLNKHKERITSRMVDIHYQTTTSGLLRGIQLPDGQLIRYNYNVNSHLQNVLFNDNTVTSIQRDTLGREVSRNQGELSTHNEYDPMGRLQKQWTVNQHHKQTTQRPIQREYEYDQFGNLSRLQDGQYITRYIYDLLDRLKRTEGDNTETFQFDPAGNLLSMGGQQSSGLVQGNRLMFQGDRKFEYNERGNLVCERRGKEGKLQTHYYYNLNNQLIKAEKDGQTTEYKYDPLGRRIEKKDTFGTTHYLWAGDQLTQEQRNHVNKTYIYEPDSFKPVAMVQDDNIYHYHLDHLGTPRELTNEAGAIVWKARYQTYGNVAVKEIEKVENNLRFQGQYFDEETGLHYNRHRYYNPGTGQFVTQDPIGLLGGINNYQYAPNPVSWVDPFGLMCEEKKYKVTPLLKEFKNENDPNNPNRWNAPMVCEYFDDQKLISHELDVKDGLIVNKSTGIPFDTADAKTHWGDAIFVMDPEGRIFVSKEQIPFELHHSSLSRGEPVAAAGEINVAQGILLTSSNKSGHYNPTNSLNNQFFNELESRGMDSAELAGVERAGWSDDGTPMEPIFHKKIGETDNGKIDNEIPYDWGDF